MPCSQGWRSRCQSPAAHECLRLRVPWRIAAEDRCICRCHVKHEAKEMVKPMLKEFGKRLDEITKGLKRSAD